jgi:23S rRNA (uracil1939-C5)-methyltransferase
MGRQIAHMPLVSGSVIEIDVDKPAAGGRMLGRHQGQVVLAWGAIPGERVRVRIERVGKGVVFGETVEVLAPSPDRRSTPGDWRCGGNVLAHVDYARQVHLKAQIIQDAFGRIGRVPLSDAPSVLPSPERGYRMRARLHARDGRLGFYREGTHALCDAVATGQLLPQTGAWLEQVETILRRDRLTGLAGLEVAENIAGDRRACHLELHAGVDAAPFVALADGLSGLSASRADAPDVLQLAGDPVVADTFSIPSGPETTLTLRRDVRAFFQSNRFLLEPLVRHVAGLVPVDRPVLDLYAGVGLFGLSLAATGAADVTLVEGDPIGGADLKANAEPFPGTHVFLRSVESYLTADRESHPDATVIVDPPRTGLSKDALAGVVRMRPAILVYVSCDPATLARDARGLLDAGYALGPLTAFDLFPNTAHIETVAVFTSTT